MKKFTSSTRIFYFIVLFFISISCSNKEDVSPITGQLSIKEARTFYEKRGKGTRPESEKKKILFWDYASEYRISEKESFVTVPLVFLDHHAIAVEDSRNRKSKDSTYTVDIKSSLIIRKKNGVLEEFILQLIKDEESYMSKKTSLITKDNFDGYAFLLDKNDKHVNVSVFKNGKEILTTEDNSKKARPNDQLVTICTTYYSQACTEGYGCGPEQVTGTSCETISMPSEEGNISFTSFATAGSTAGGGSGSGSPLDAFQDLPGFIDFMNSINPAERTYYSQRLQLVPKAIKSRYLANQFIDYYYCTNADLGNPNAFKHAIWSGMNALLFSNSHAFEMAEIHETGSPNYNPTDISTLMDYHNNSLGINVLNQHRSDIMSHPASTREYILAGIILANIANGDGVKVSPTYTLTNTTGADRCH